MTAARLDGGRALATRLAPSSQAAERARTQAQQERWRREAEQRRLEEVAREAEVARQREEDLERNKGVAFIQRLQPVLSLAGEAKGIVRRADKLTLPPSAKAALMEQQATKNGQLFFELAIEGGNASRVATHGSILEFTAREGTVGAPPEVLRCLGLAHLADGPEGQPAAPGLLGGSKDATVRYRLLKKGTSAKVQPELSAFQADVTDIKSLLESELMLRTTLSQGDRIVVREGDESYVLRVVDLEPESAISLIDTDLEVDILPSVQAEAAAAAEAEAERRLQEAKRLAEERRRQEEEAAAAAAAAQQQQAADAAAAAAARRQQRRELAAAALAALAAEDPMDDGRAVSVAIRCPDGARCVGRFAPSAPLSALFMLVEAQWSEAVGTELCAPRKPSPPARPTTPDPRPTAHGPPPAMHGPRPTRLTAAPFSAIAPAPHPPSLATLISAHGVPRRPPPSRAACQSASSLRPRTLGGSSRWKQAARPIHRFRRLRRSQTQASRRHRRPSSFSFRSRSRRDQGGSGRETAGPAVGGAAAGDGSSTEEHLCARSFGW